MVICPQLVASERTRLGDKARVNTVRVPQFNLSLPISEATMAAWQYPPPAASKAHLLPSWRMPRVRALILPTLATMRREQICHRLRHLLQCRLLQPRTFEKTVRDPSHLWAVERELTSSSRSNSKHKAFLNASVRGKPRSLLWNLRSVISTGRIKPFFPRWKSNTIHKTAHRGHWRVEARDRLRFAGRYYRVHGWWNVQLRGYYCFLTIRFVSPTPHPRVSQSPADNDGSTAAEPWRPPALEFD